MVKKTKNKEEKVFCSMIEFKKKYLPKSLERKISEEPKNTHNLGISWAKESLDKIRGQLDK